MMECEHCDYDTDTENKLRTHMLLHHRDEIEDNMEFEASVSEGWEKEGTRAEKGEQFGYRR